MTLGQLIKKLEEVKDKGKVIEFGFGNPHSWRGSYDQLAFEPKNNVTIQEMLDDAKKALNSTYYGHKGGQYTMVNNTSINIDYEGDWSDGECLWNLLLTLIFNQESGAINETK